MIFRILRMWTRAVLAAMLLAALAPAISRTLSASRGVGDWVQICTGSRVSWVQVGATPDQASPDGANPSLSQLDGCGLCLLAAERFAPLIPAVPVVAGTAGTFAAIELHGLSLLCVSAPVPSARGPPTTR